MEFLTLVAKPLTGIETFLDSHVSADPEFSNIICDLLTLLSVLPLYNSHSTVPLLCYIDNDTMHLSLHTPPTILRLDKHLGTQKYNCPCCKLRHDAQQQCAT